MIFAAGWAFDGVDETASLRRTAQQADKGLSAARGHGERDDGPKVMVFGLSAQWAFFHHDHYFGLRNDRTNGKLRIPIEDGDCTIRYYWHIRTTPGTLLELSSVWVPRDLKITIVYEGPPQDMSSNTLLRLVQSVVRYLPHGSLLCGGISQ